MMQNLLVQITGIQMVTGRYKEVSAHAKGGFEAASKRQMVKSLMRPAGVQDKHCYTHECRFKFAGPGVTKNCDTKRCQLQLRLCFRV